MQLIVVRHGETKENAEGIVQGQVYGTLSETGLLQIQEVGKKLAPEKFDVCYASDLERCVLTAAAITQHHDGLQTMYDKRLRERSMKPLEGQYFDKIQGWDWENDKFLDHKTLEGESWAELIGRVKSLLEELKAKYDDKALLIVTHGGPIRAMVYLLDGGDWADVGRMQIGNCEVRRWEV